MTSSVGNGIKLVNINGITMLSAERLNATGSVQAYFSTRLGGISSGECGDMNLNLFKNQDVENSRRNMGLFCDTLGIDQKTLVANRLMHTNIIREVDASSVKHDFYELDSYPHADGMVTNSPEVTLFLYSSDCAVFFFYDPVHGAIGGTHAGWRGTLNGILENTVKEMGRLYGSNPKDLLIAVGPSIAQCCFEVDEPVMQQFVGYDPSFASHILANGSKYHIDLPAINRKVLLRTGVLFENIDMANYCTMCDNNLFHSYRHGKGENGVNGAFLRIRC